MLVRFIVFIFTFNTLFFSAAFATGMPSDCKMKTMAQQQTASTQLNGSSTHCMMQDMQKDCDSSNCLEACAVTSIPLITYSHLQFLPDVAVKPPEKMAYFYQITLPVKTPPPLA